MRIDDERLSEQVEALRKRVFSFRHKPAINRILVEFAHKMYAVGFSHGKKSTEPPKGQEASASVEAVPNAVKVLTAALKADEGFWITYKANIAMAFYDEYRRTGNNLSHDAVHKVANIAAENFLRLWCEGSHTTGIDKEAGNG